MDIILRNRILKRSFLVATVLAICWLAFAFIAMKAQADATRYVKAGGTGDGASWATASGTLQAMIDVVAASGGGTVCVASGTYTPGNQRIDAFHLKSGVGIYGGFPNTGSPAWKDRDWHSSKAVLSGEIGNSGTTTDNCYHVLIYSGTPLSSAILDGFTIKGGYANGEYPHNSGGGLYSTQSSLLVQNCTFAENSAEVGGAVYNLDSDNTFANCIYWGNTASFRGGAMLNDQSSVSWQYTAAPELQQDLMIDLTLTGTGSVNGEPCYIAENEFEEDLTFPFCYEGTCFDVTLQSITFAQNIVHRDFIQQAINLTIDYLWGIPLTVPVDYTYTNRPEMLTVGGTWAFSTEIDIPLFGVHEETSWNARVVGTEEIAVVAGTFTCYRVEALSDTGSAVVSWWDVDGTMLCPVKYQLPAFPQFELPYVELANYPNYAPVITNCIFSGNQAASGGAIYNAVGSLPQVTNCILWEDKPREIQTEAGICPVTYSNVDNNTGVFPGTGNIFGTPMFVNPASGDFHLSPESPCIDAGDTNAPDLPHQDFEGDDRIRGKTIDMGADETCILTISKSGSGTVIPPVGAYSLDEVSQLSIEAIADPGWTFKEWEGDVSTIEDTNDASTSISSEDCSTSLTAVFIQKECASLQELLDSLGEYLDNQISVQALLDILNRYLTCG